MTLSYRPDDAKKKESDGTSLEKTIGSPAC